MSRITDMIAHINKVGGLVTSNRFAVEITPPTSLQAQDRARSIPFLCDTVNAPGIQFGVESVKHKGYGLGEKRPTSMEMDDITATFFIDNKRLILGFFQRWMQHIISFDPNHSRSKVSEMSLESFNYPEEYWGTMVVLVKNISDETVISYTFDKVFPLNMGTITFGWENNDTLARIPITFSYRSFSTEETISTSTTDNASIDTSVINLSPTEAINRTNEILYV